MQFVRINLSLCFILPCDRMSGPLKFYKQVAITGIGAEK